MGIGKESIKIQSLNHGTSCNTSCIREPALKPICGLQKLLQKKIMQNRPDQKLNFKVSCCRISSHI